MFIIHITISSRSEFYLYDAIGRLVMTGLATPALPAEDACPAMTAGFKAGQQSIDGTGYTAPAGVTLDNPVPTVVNYYDSYACKTLTGFKSLNAPFTTSGMYTARGRLTGQRVAVVQGQRSSNPSITDASNSLYTLIGYDEEGNIVNQSENTYARGTTLKQQFSYTRQGKPLFETQEFYLRDSVYSTEHQYRYDTAGFLKSESFTVESKRKGMNLEVLGKLINSYTYDALGRLRYTDNNLFRTDYCYNLREELVAIVNPLLEQEMVYDNGSNPCYNGNISSIRLKYFSDEERRLRVYTYDSLNRLKKVASNDGTDVQYSYSLNSSPLTIFRTGIGSDGNIVDIDELWFVYKGNQLTKVSDKASPVILESSADMPHGTFRYEYDISGRMTEDDSRGVQTSYSHLDQPARLCLKDGSRVLYGYSALGQKLMKYFEPRNINLRRPNFRYYCNGAEFVADETQYITADRFYCQWGYIDHGGAHIILRDFQGNVRAVINATNGQVEQTTDYYPYGMPMQSSTGAEVNRYKYGGKEFETEDGLNQYDFEARTQLPQLGLFTTTDPKAGDYPSLNPYLYCAANPIKYIDPTGKYFIGTDNKPVTYINGQWSANTPADTKRYASYLEKTPTGKGILNDILNSDIRTSVTFKNEIKRNISTKGRIIFGKTDVEPIDEKNPTVLNADIEIYEGTIRENAIYYKGSTKDYRVVPANDKLMGLRLQIGLSAETHLEEVCGHEGRHATDKENLTNMDHDIQKREERADETAFKILLDILTGFYEDKR